MKGVDIVLKASLMIFLIVSISFMSSDLSFVSAEEEEHNVCCEQTTAGDTCVYAPESSCDESYLQSSTTCELTAFCKPGCCISDVGKCSKGVGQSTCNSIEGYSWNEGADCSEVEACEKNCCVIAESQCSYTTEANCEILIEDLVDITLDWRDVDSESSCTNICKASDRGCCVSSDSCTYGTQAECENPDVNLQEGFGFYKEKYCSDFGQCACIEHDSKQCVNEDVYWFDSCGNQEEVVARNDIDSNGEVVTEDGDCDYTSGTWCGTQDGEVSCLSTDCDTLKTDSETGKQWYTFDGMYYTDLENPGEVGTGVDRNRHDLRIGGVRENGESWCLYESPAGGYKDFPGSQHYRSFCYFGEEIIEPCADYREEVCLQVPYDVYFGIDEYGIWSSEYSDTSYTGPTGSACVDNVDNEILNPNTTTVSVGNNWDDSDLAGTCETANIECTVSYAKDAWTDPSFQASQNVRCTSPQWVKGVHEYCRSKGDCGATMNVIGEFTNDGFYMSRSQEFLTAYDDNNKSHRVYVGYDTCVDHFIDEGTRTYIGEGKGEEELTNQIKAVNDRLQEAVFCLYDCDTAEKGTDDLYGDCTFISEISEEELYTHYDGGEESEYYQKLYANEDDDLILEGGFPSLTLEQDLGQYGVYGGLSAISSVFADAELGEVSNLGWTWSMYATNIVGAAAAGALLIGGLAVVGTSAGLGATFGAAGSLGLTTIPPVPTILSSTDSIISTSTTIGTSVAGVVIIVAALAIIVFTLTSWAETASITNPEERQKATKDLAVASTVAAGLSAVLLTIAVAGSSLPPFGWIVSLVALAVSAFVAVISYGGQVREITISSHCEAWQPPSGSEYCTLCDLPVSQGGLAIDDGEGNILTGYECTEYKCKSLGKSCEYITENQGTDRATCIGVDVNDKNRPIIDEIYIYDDYADLRESATEKKGEYGGYEALTLTGTVDPYTYFTFGIETDELSQCKIQIGDQPPATYAELETYFPDSYFDYQHNQTWILTPEETYNFYISCVDYAGNGESPAVPFVLQVTTGVGKDVTPPSIEATSIKNGAYVAAGVNETQFSIYLDGPVQGCRWSTTDQEYSLMEWPFVCPGVPDSASAYFNDDCSTVLNVNEVNNYYYIACEDAEGNSNIENYPFTLIATGPLDIDSVSPSGTLYYDYTTLAVQTSGGAEDGKAICSYDGIQFYQTNSSLHQQPLEDLAAGDYSFAIDCQDVAGNQNSTTIDFSIEVDVTSPVLEELYKSETTVYYSLSEDASCEYYYEDFIYGGGTSVSGSFSLTDVPTYYLKCQDSFGNEGAWIINV